MRDGPASRILKDAGAHLSLKHLVGILLENPRRDLRVTFAVWRQSITEHLYHNNREGFNINRSTAAIALPVVGVVVIVIAMHSLADLLCVVESSEI